MVWPTLAQHSRALQLAAQVVEQEFHLQPGLAEDDRLRAAAYQLRHQGARLPGSAAPDPQSRLDDRRVQHHHSPDRCRSPVAIHTLDRAPQESLGQLLGIGDGGGAADVGRLGPIERADPVQPPDHVCDVAAKDSAVGVELVEDHVAQPLEEAHPLGVVGQDPRVEHVRVGENDLARLAQGGPSSGRSVTVVGEGA